VAVGGGAEPIAAAVLDEPNRAWVADITYIRTHEGWLYLAGAIDLFPRQVIGCSMRC